MTKLSLGQKLWIVFRERYLGEPRFMVVTKVGREYAQIESGRYRVRMENLRVLSTSADGSVLGDAYTDKADYEAKLQFSADYELLCRKFRDRYTPWDGLTHDMVRRAAAALDLTLQKMETV